MYKNIKTSGDYSPEMIEYHKDIIRINKKIKMKNINDPLEGFDWEQIQIPTNFEDMLKYLIYQNQIIERLLINVSHTLIEQEEKGGK